MKAIYAQKDYDQWEQFGVQFVLSMNVMLNENSLIDTKINESMFTLCENS